MALKKGEESYAPMEERWLVRDVTAIVDWQNPVAVLHHGIRHYRFTRLAFAIEIGESEKRHREHHSDNAHYRKRLVVVVVHNG